MKNFTFLLMLLFFSVGTLMAQEGATQESTFTNYISDITTEVVIEYPDGVKTAKEEEAKGENNCNSSVVCAIQPVYVCGSH